MAITAKYACDILSSRVSLTPNYDGSKTSFISAYGIFETNQGKTVVIRVSDHGTYLFHWVEKREILDVSLSANYAVTFKDAVAITHNNKILGASQTIVVRQYVYDCSLLNEQDVEVIVNAVVNLAQNGVYTDPFIGTPKHATIWREETNKPPRNITSKVAKQKRKRERKRRNSD